MADAQTAIQGVPAVQTNTTFTQRLQSFGNYLTTWFTSPSKAITGKTTTENFWDQLMKYWWVVAILVLILIIYGWGFWLRVRGK